MKKKKKNTISGGIIVNDSIMLSISKKKSSHKNLISVIFAVIGFTSVINIFFAMFPVHCDRTVLTWVSVACMIIYGTVTLFKGKSAWIIPITMIILILLLLKNVNAITDGFKYVYNVIYQETNYTHLEYFQDFNMYDEMYAVTLFMIFCVWFMSIIICFFTIHSPNPIATVCLTFPILELGLFFGIDVPVFWASLLIAYWFAVLSVYSCDTGEYDGGNGGFTRKGNIFFPKKNMRLKVTEKCALQVVAAIMAISVVSTFLLDFFNYERSEKLNETRRNMRQAFDTFTWEDLFSSISGITDSLGITVEYEDNRLGKKNSVEYKNVTDLEVTFDKAYNHSVYMKGYVGSIYGNNEWTELDSGDYNNYDVFEDFKTYDLYPQQFTYIFNDASVLRSAPVSVTVDNKRKRNKSYIPYGISGGSDERFNLDTTGVFEPNDIYSYKMSPVNSSETLFMYNTLTPYSAFSSENNYRHNDIIDFCSDYGTDRGNCLIPGITDGQNKDAVLASLLEMKYRDFVYDNYLTVPDNEAFDEVYDAYSNILRTADTSTVWGRMDTLDRLRKRINDNTEYTLSPGKTPSNRDFVNYFLLENKLGYCVNYATAGVMLARMAGIPARYATGYIIVSDDFNSKTRNNDGSYTLSVKDNRSHAWAEIYFDGYGWVPFEFTSGYLEYLNGNPNDDSTSTNTATDLTNTATSAPKASGTGGSRGSRSTGASGTNTNTQTTAKKSGGAIGMGTGIGGAAGKFRLQIMLLTLGSAALFTVIVLIRRGIILKRRIKQFGCRDRAKAVKHIYLYVENLLEHIGYIRNNQVYSDFIKNVGEELVKAYELKTDSAEFSDFMQTALKAQFGNSEISPEELDLAKKFAFGLSYAVNKKSNVFNKLYYKYLFVT